MRTILLALLVAAPLSAQQAQSDAVPRELVITLLGGSRLDGPDPNLVVGRAPTSFPSNTLPPNATVLGGLEHAWGATVVLRVPPSPDSSRASLAAQLQRSGWRAVEPQYGHGFVPSSSGGPLTFCRDSATLSLAVRERSAGGSLVALSSSSVRDRGPCSERDRTRQAELDRPELPRLEAPRGARMLGSGMGGGREAREAFTRLESTMSAADIAAHYARQLAAAGWTVTEPTTGSGVLMYGVRHRDDENRPLAGFLVVLDLPESQQREVLLRVARAEPMR